MYVFLSALFYDDQLYTSLGPFRDWNYIQPHHNAYWAGASQPPKRFCGLTIYC
jgi:hypothetical protein